VSFGNTQKEYKNETEKNYQRNSFRRNLIYSYNILVKMSELGQKRLRDVLIEDSDSDIESVQTILSEHLQKLKKNRTETEPDALVPIELLDARDTVMKSGLIYEYSNSFYAKDDGASSSDEDIKTVSTDLSGKSRCSMASFKNLLPEEGSAKSVEDGSAKSVEDDISTVLTSLTKMTLETTPTVIDIKEHGGIKRTKQFFDDIYLETFKSSSSSSILNTIYKKYLDDSDDSEDFINDLIDDDDNTLEQLKGDYKQIFGDLGLFLKKYDEKDSVLHIAFFPTDLTGAITKIDADSFRKSLIIAMIKDLTIWANCIKYMTDRTKIKFFKKFELIRLIEGTKEEEKDFSIVEETRDKVEYIIDTDIVSDTTMPAEVVVNDDETQDCSQLTDEFWSAQNTPLQNYDSDDDRTNHGYGGKKSKAKKGLKKNHKTNKKRSNRSFMVKGKKTKPRKTQRKKNKKKKTQRKKFVVKKDIKKKTKRVRFNL